MGSQVAALNSLGNAGIHYVSKLWVKSFGRVGNQSNRISNRFACLGEVSGKPLHITQEIMAMHRY